MEAEEEAEAEAEAGAEVVLRKYELRFEFSQTLGCIVLNIYIYIYCSLRRYGEETWSLIKKTDCGLFPQDKPSPVLQHVRYIAEVFIPLTVALSFGQKRASLL